MKGLHFEWNYLKCLSKITLWPDGNVQSSQEVGTEISPQNPPKVKSRPLHNVEKFCQLEKFCHKPMKHLMSCSQWNVYQKQHYGQMEMFNHHRKLVRNQKVKSRPLYNLEKSCQLEKFCHSPNKWTSLYRHLKRTQTFARLFECDVLNYVPDKTLKIYLGPCLRHLKCTKHPGYEAQSSSTQKVGFTMWRPFFDSMHFRPWRLPSGGFLGWKGCDTAKRTSRAKSVWVYSV